jgi:hypothetical protein
MGSIVKSIGKAIKKVGKSIKKIVKKIGPALVVAAAVYTGVSFLGAGGMAGGVGSLSPSNFSLGLEKIGKFFLPSLGEQTGTQAATSFSTEVGLGSASAIADAGAAIAPSGIGSSVGDPSLYSSIADPVASTATNVLADAKSTISDYIFASNGEMSTGQALAYMAKLNMYKTGADIVLSLFDTSEQDLLEQKHKYDLEIMDKQAEIEIKMQGISQAHDAAMQEAALSAQYAYGAPSGGGSGTFTHPSLMPAGSQQMQRMPAGQMQLANLATQFTPQPAQQSIGQPTLGRARTRNFEPPVPSAASPRPPGLLTQAARKEIV